MGPRGTRGFLYMTILEIAQSSLKIPIGKIYKLLNRRPEKSFPLRLESDNYILRNGGIWQTEFGFQLQNSGNERFGFISCEMISNNGKIFLPTKSPAVVAVGYSSFGFNPKSFGPAIDGTTYDFILKFHNQLGEKFKFIQKVRIYHEKDPRMNMPGRWEIRIDGIEKIQKLLFGR